MSSVSFNWAVIGPGRIAHRFAEAVTAQSNMRVRSVLGRDLARASEFAAKWSQHPTHPVSPTTQLNDVLSDPDIHGVYIATPHAFHAASIRAALNARKPVLCEKPLVTDARSARELVALAVRQKTFLMEAVWTRFLPLHSAVCEWLKAERIGKLLSMQSSFCFAAPFNPSSRLYDPAQAGGALLDIGIYNLTVTRMMLQAASGTSPELSRIEAKATLAPSGVDQRLHATLHFPDGVASQFVCAIDTVADNSFRIYGEKGSITIHGGFWQATRATLARMGEASVEIHHPFRVNGFEYEIEAAVNAIREGRAECERMPHSETIATLEWMDHIRAEIGVRYPFE